MKNKLIRPICVLVLLCMLLPCSILAVSATNTTTGVDFNGLSFYDTQAVSIGMPVTFEATICLPENISGRGGVIIGNYDGQKKALFNFEIYNNGAPRIYINDTSLVNYDVIFSNVDLRNGKPTHVAITYDAEASSWYCYINGELKQTVNKAAPEKFQMPTSQFRLGGDYRTGNTQYFKGIIQRVALYSDVRTAQEIAADVTATAVDTSNLITAYDISKNPLGNYPKSIESATNQKLNFSYYSDWLLEVDEPKNYAYSFAVLGDIQTLTYGYPDVLNNMYKWIRDNAESKKIKFVVGLGDITDKNTDVEYERVNAAYDIIDGTVPFSIIRGNHDRSGTSSTASAKFDSYITKAKYGDEISGSYDNTMKNTYRILQIGDIKYMFMNLDFLMKDEVIEWAGDVISSNQDCHVIVSTHIYMNASGSYNSLDSITKYGCENNGEDLWNKLLSQHKNIVMLLTGHNPTDDILCRKRYGKHGNTVTEILVDPQTTDKDRGGTGLVAMLYFSEDGKQLDVRYYSTAKNAYFKRNNQFSRSIDYIKRPETNKQNEVSENTTKQPETTTQAIETTVVHIDKKNGCNSSISLTSIFIVTTISAFAVFIYKKKKEY
ncbi:MAG: hypothetical protein E7670_01000 [Ruminococcaceae bacterium]|nr:hypothetical protein [Oscillospiraceae bacterium]